MNIISENDIVKFLKQFESYQLVITEEEQMYLSKIVVDQKYNRIKFIYKDKYDEHMVYYGTFQNGNIVIKDELGKDIWSYIDDLENNKGA